MSLNYAVPLISMLAVVLLLGAASLSPVYAQNMSGNETSGNMSAATNMTNTTVGGNMTDVDNIAPSTPVIPN
jgi:hypothetical protein